MKGNCFSSEFSQGSTNGGSRNREMISTQGGGGGGGERGSHIKKTARKIVKNNVQDTDVSLGQCLAT